MKKITLFLVSVLFVVQMNAQGVGISDDGSQPHSSAQLDIQSTTKGFLPPVMTQDQRNAISNPAPGLQIYNSDTKEPNYYNGSEWKSMVASAEVPVSEVVDIDGNVYTTVVIGAQEWFVEDLKTTKYNDGTEIPFIATFGGWEYLETPAYTFYDAVPIDQVQDNLDYGYLYNWYIVDAASNGNKNVCPIGWHVPTDGEWTLLTEELGGEAIAGGKLKEAGYTHWTEDVNGVATNSSGFTGLPGGYRASYDGYCYYLGSRSDWWSTSSSDQYNAFYRKLNHDDIQVVRAGVNKKFGFSIRCMKDI